MKALGLMVSDKKIFSRFSKSDYVKHVTPRVGPFLVPWLNFDKPGRGLLVDATYQISKHLGLVVSDKNIFSCFPYISICITCDPGGGPILGPRGII